jgi:hypothetical protein
MLLEKIPVKMAAAAFAAEFSHIKKTSETVTLTETAAGGEIFYRLVFRDDRLSLLNLSINGDFTQNAYDDLTTLMKSIIYTQKSRGFTTAPQETGTLAWKELIESPLPDTGSPAERSIPVFHAGWDMPSTKAILSFAWTWPGQLALDYKEESE